MSDFIIKIRCHSGLFSLDSKGEIEIPIIHSLNQTIYVLDAQCYSTNYSTIKLSIEILGANIEVGLTGFSSR